jgi:elongation factor Tu
MMPIEGACTISGRGTVVTGRVERGVLTTQQKVHVIGGDELIEAVVIGTQEFHQDVPEARAGHNVGLLLRGVARGQVQRGMLVVAPNTVHSRTAGKAEIFVLTAAEGGRRRGFGSGYTPQLYFGATDVPARLLVNTGEVSPGDHTTCGLRARPPGGHRGGHALRHARGRPHHRRGRGDGDELNDTLSAAAPGE